MFEDALFATNRRRTREQRWAAALSFTLQAALVTVIVALPLFFTEALPLDYVRSFVQVPLPPPGRTPPSPPTERTHQRSDSNVDQQGHLIEVRVIPRTVTPINENVAPPRVGDGDIGVIGAPSLDGDPNGVIHSIATESARRLEALKPPPPTKTLIVSHIDEGLLVHKVTPTYPHIAQMTRIQGAVLLHAIIGKDGTIQQLQVVSGPPLLVQAAVDAVKQWRYRPYVLNGEPVEVDTQITVNFKLGG